MQVPRDSAPKPSQGSPGRARPASNGAGAAARVAEPQAEDAERRVREALAEHLRRCPHLPPSLAKTLSADALSLRLPTDVHRTPPAAPSEDEGAVNGTGPQAARQPLDELQHGPRPLS